MATIPKARAKVEAEKKVFFHQHPLQRDHIDHKRGVTCRFCLEDEITPSMTYMCPICPNYAVHWGCAKYKKECRHASHPHMLKLVQKYSKVGCDGCGNSIDRGFYYTCTEQVTCNFDLHPLCATLSSELLLPALHNLGFHSNTRAPSTLARQHSGTSRVPPKRKDGGGDIEEPRKKQSALEISKWGSQSRPQSSQSNVHSPAQGHASMSPGPRPRVSNGDRGEEERRRAKQAAEEQRRKEQAAAAALKEREQEKAVRREEKAKQDEWNDRLQSFRMMVEKRDDERNNQLQSIREKIVKIEASGAKRHQEYISGLKEIIRTQVQSTTRAVPRLILCAEGTSTALKLLTVVPVGLKSVQLHLLCEDAEQPHVVAGAKGCQIYQKVEGDRWNNLQPFIAAGLQIVAMAIMFGTASAGLTPLNTLLPNLSQKVWDTRAIDLGKYAVPSGPKKRVPNQDLLAKEEAEEAAAEWLLSYLKDQKINIAQAFGLYRVRYINTSNHLKGTIGWLCQNHLEQGSKEETLERFPVRR